MGGGKGDPARESEEVPGQYVEPAGHHARQPLHHDAAPSTHCLRPAEPGDRSRPLRQYYYLTLSLHVYLVSLCKHVALGSLLKKILSTSPMYCM